MGREFEPHRGHKRNRQKSIPLFLQTCIARDLQSAVRSRPRSFTQVNSLRPLTPSLRISRTLQVCFQNCIARDLPRPLRLILGHVPKYAPVVFALRPRHLAYSPSLLSILHSTQSAAPAVSHPRSRTQVRSRRLRLTAATSRVLSKFAFKIV